MSDRRSARRDLSRDRRSFPRPPLWLNLALLVIALGTFVYARHQRDLVAKKSAVLFRRSGNSPAEVNRVRDQLAQMDLTEGELAKQLDVRMQYAESLKSAQFYIAVDTARKKMYFRLGNEILREMDVQGGEAKSLKGSNGRSWNVIPVKGAFTIAGKAAGLSWQVPEWAYALAGQPIPDSRPTIENGLGKYVIFLPNNYVIHSPPSPDSPLKGPKPGSYMVPEDDLAAIWPRISTETRVYIF
jgi:hypothetical protein